MSKQERITVNGAGIHWMLYSCKIALSTLNSIRQQSSPQEKKDIKEFNRIYNGIQNVNAYLEQREKSESKQLSFLPKEIHCLKYSSKLTLSALERQMQEKSLSRKDSNNIADVFVHIRDLDQFLSTID